MKFAPRLLFLGLSLLVTSLIIMPSQVEAQFFFMENGLEGEPAPEFDLKLVGGSMTKMSEYRQELSAIVFFWATWCPHCREQLKEMNAEKEEFARQGIKLVIVDVGEEERVVANYMKKKQIDLDVFLDQDSAVSEEYGIIGVPTFFFVNKEGEIQAIKHSLPDNYARILSK